MDKVLKRGPCWVLESVFGKLEKVYPGSLPCFDLIQGEADSVATITDYQMNTADKKLPLFWLRLNGHLIEESFMMKQEHSSGLLSHRLLDHIVLSITRQMAHTQQGIPRCSE